MKNIFKKSAFKIGTCKIILPLLFLLLAIYLMDLRDGEQDAFFLIVINLPGYILASVFYRAFPNSQFIKMGLSSNLYCLYYLVTLVVLWFTMGSILDFIIADIRKKLKEKRDKDF